MSTGVKISPSILSADFSKLGSEISKLEKVQSREISKSRSLEVGKILSPKS